MKRSYCGIFLVNGNAFDGSGDTFGILCGLLSAVMYSFMVIFNKKTGDMSILPIWAIETIKEGRKTPLSNPLISYLLHPQSSHLSNPGLNA